jgi:hypothetical protein
MISPIIVVGGITIRPANGKRAILEDLTGADALRKGVGIDERLERRTDLAGCLRDDIQRIGSCGAIKAANE